MTKEVVDHPQHYNIIPGIECIDVVEHMTFLRGNAIKYLWRAGVKGNVVEDLRKAIWYIQREIDNHENNPAQIFSDFEDEVYGLPEAVEDVKEYICSLLQPYLGDDFRQAEVIIRRAE